MKKLLSYILMLSLVASSLVLNISAVTMTTTNVVYLWPVPVSTFMTSRCGEDGHLGIDITTVTADTVVVAARDGVVTVSRPTDCTHTNRTCPGGYCNGGCGNYVIIEHSDGTRSKYYHFRYDTICVAVGQKVKAGDKLGIMGSSGNSTGTHLHFELRDSDNVLINNNPESIDYVFKNTNITASAEYELWQITSAYNIRSAPSVNADKIGSVGSHTFIAVSEWKNAEGGTWAKILFTGPNNDAYCGKWIGLDDEKFIKNVKLTGGKSIDTTSTDTDSDTQTDSDVATDKDSDSDLPEPKPTPTTWLIDPDTHLRIRDGAGTSYDTVGWLSGEELVGVTEIVSSGGYKWGLIDNINGDKTYSGKWCSLDYASEVETDIDVETQGDINNDKIVDIIDVTILRGYIVGSVKLSELQKKSADLNKDNSINVIDLAKLRSMIISN